MSSFLKRFLRWIFKRKVVAGLDHVRDTPAMARDIGVHVTRIPLASGGEKVIVEQVLDDDIE